MGYSTTFKGELGFAQPLTAEQQLALYDFFGEDVRDHPEWNDTERLYVIDLMFNKDRTGVKWNGVEKTYDMPKVINLITRVMREQWPDFSFTGYFEAIGEDGEFWVMRVKDGVAADVEARLVPVDE